MTCPGSTDPPLQKGKETVTDFMRRLSFPPHLSYLKANRWEEQMRAFKFQTKRPFPLLGADWDRTRLPEALCLCSPPLACGCLSVSVILALPPAAPTALKAFPHPAGWLGLHHVLGPGPHADSAGLPSGEGVIISPQWHFIV